MNSSWMRRSSSTPASLEDHDQLPANSFERGIDTSRYWPGMSFPWSDLSSSQKQGGQATALGVNTLDRTGGRLVVGREACSRDLGSVGG
jgi:hypothetical protein